MAEINGTTHSAEMAEGAKSQFDVIADGKLVFSKAETGRFPEDGEVRAALASSS